ncbi:hypothetical protein J6590_043540 [Homalodisca vitripennis]|nr:hypothetical protein J6590_043540 [Homalodisca vitripennis]
MFDGDISRGGCLAIHGRCGIVGWRLSPRSRTYTRSPGARLRHTAAIKLDPAIDNTVRRDTVWRTTGVGRDIHEYETRGRDNYRSGMHRTVVYEHLPSQAGVHFINRLPNKIKNASTPKVLKTRIKLCLASNAFYSVDEFLAFNWETTR